MSGKTNVQLLAGSQAFNLRAKKARREQVETIKFDDEARREWLTGFSKRKKAKTEERKARAKERERAEHLEERKKARQDLKERAAENVKAVRAAMGLSETIDEPEAGPSSPREEMAEYSDEDQLATVTITEDFDPSSSLPTLSRPPLANGESSSPPPPPSKKSAAPLMPASSARAMGKAKREKEKAKLQKAADKERSRSMETKSERRKGKEMEARRRTKRAAMAMDRYGSSGERKKKAGVKLKKKFR